MKRVRTCSRTAAGLAVGLAMLIALTAPVFAQEPPLDEQLAEIVLQIETELNLLGAPAEIVDRCSNTVVDSPATGLDRENFIANLANELAAIVEDEAALEIGLAAVDALVAEYLDLAGGA